MFNLKEKLKEYQINDIEQDILRLEYECLNICSRIKEYKDECELYYLCTKYISTKNAIFKITKEKEELEKEKEVKNDQYINA